MCHRTNRGTFDKRTFSVQYVVADPRNAPLRHHRSGARFRWEVRIDRNVVGRQAPAAYSRRKLHTRLDTRHASHADHFSAAAYLKEKTGVRTAIGEKVVGVQRLWKDIYNYPASFSADGSQWDRLFEDGERFAVGKSEAEVMLTPGHTLASIAYRIGDAVFVHDTLFQPDYGTARADFPSGGPLLLRCPWGALQGSRCWRRPWPCA